MNYQYVHTINNMGYIDLVNMLGSQITPDIRKLILERLTAMNNELLNINEQHYYQTQPTRSSRMSRRPPTPTLFSPPESPEIDLDEILENPKPRNEPDDLDIRLARIKLLYDKIIMDKKRRRESRK